MWQPVRYLPLEKKSSPKKEDFAPAEQIISYQSSTNGRTFLADLFPLRVYPFPLKIRSLRNLNNEVWKSNKITDKEPNLNWF